MKLKPLLFSAALIVLNVGMIPEAKAHQAGCSTMSSYQITQWSKWHNLVKVAGTYVGGSVSIYIQSSWDTILELRQGPGLSYPSLGHVHDCEVYSYSYVANGQWLLLHNDRGEALGWVNGSTKYVQY